MARKRRVCRTRDKMVKCTTAEMEGLIGTRQMNLWVSPFCMYVLMHIMCVCECVCVCVCVSVCRSNNFVNLFCGVASVLACIRIGIALGQKGVSEPHYAVCVCVCVYIYIYIYIYYIRLCIYLMNVHIHANTRIWYYICVQVGFLSQRVKFMLKVPGEGYVTCAQGPMPKRLRVPVRCMYVYLRAVPVCACTCVCMHERYVTCV